MCMRHSTTIRYLNPVSLKSFEAVIAPAGLFDASQVTHQSVERSVQRERREAMGTDLPPEGLVWVTTIHILER
jgi:hypothetical protein